jgi:uncharacterized OB-fold protein
MNLIEPSTSQGGGNTKQILITPERVCFPDSSPEKPYLIGSKCDICGIVCFPEKEVCPSCIRGKTMRPVPLSGKGKVDSFSISYVAPPGFSAPYIQSWIELIEGPRIFSLITGCEPSEQALEIGMDVEFVVGKIAEDEDGNDLLCYQFQPVR